jgi:hypothetical protein
MECYRCSHDNPPDNTFCGSCGTALDPSASPLRKLLQENLSVALEKAIQDRLDQRQHVEKELAERVSKQSRLQITRAAALTVIICLVLSLLVLSSDFLIHYKFIKRNLQKAVADLDDKAAIEAKVRADADVVRNLLRREEADLLVSGKAGKPITAAELRDMVSAEINSQFNDRWKDQKLLRLETAEMATKDVTEAAKDIAYWVGIPAALILGLLGFLGLKNYTDFKTKLEAALSNYQVDLDKKKDEVHAKMLAQIDLFGKQMDEKAQKVDEQISTYLEQLSTGLRDALEALSPLPESIRASVASEASRPPGPENPK